MYDSYWSSSPCGGVPQMQNLRVPLVAAQGYRRFPLSKHVSLNIALRAVLAYRASTYLDLVTAFLAHSTSFSPNFHKPQ